MRKNTSLAIAATILTLSMIVWAASGATQADKTGSVSASSSLTIQSLPPIW
jgi:hypothetical protein